MSEKTLSYNKEEILRLSQEAIGKKFSEINYVLSDNNTANKGYFGQLLESSVFDYSPNSRSEPDFLEAGIELKLTPYKKLKNGMYSAKERVVLNIINYMDEYKQSFETSSFWKKNQSLLLLFYLYQEDISFEEFVITHSLLFEYPEEDLQIIKSDWNIIVDKIKAGLAHELSEADTMYLGACTKGATSQTVRTQPFSNILAKQRAFSLKNSYITQILRTYVFNKDTEKVYIEVKTENQTFEEYISSKLSVYVGKTQHDLAEMFGISSVSKQLNELLVSKMLGLKGKVSKSDQFVKANIIPKTVRIEENGKIKESMSFPAFKYTELVNEEWDNSNLRQMFESTRFMLILFKKQNSKYTFSGVKFWNMPLTTLDNDVKSVWETTKKLISSGRIVRHIVDGKIYSYFPGMKDNLVCHVRPHAKNRNDVYELPIQDKLTKVMHFTKHCFWLNSSFIHSIILSK